MPDFPDVLDHLGKTPREFGAVHIYVEPVVRAEDGYACATIWLQAALVPLAARGMIEVLATRVPVPELADGSVMQAKVPLAVSPGVEEVSFGVQCEAPKNAARVRQAWKLFDTFEIPKESEMKTYNDDSAGIGVGGLFLANALTLPLGAIVIPRGGASVGGGLAESTRATVHKARTLTAGFVAKVVAGDPERITTVAWTRIWRPGQPLPTVAAPVLVLQPIAAKTNDPSSRRVCSGCNFSGRRVDFGTDRYCPNCGHEWD